jgi:SAM-dependent MidA family methyltransferase
LANELIDNLPMAVAQRTTEGWRERWVGLDGDVLVWIDADPRPAVVAWLEAFAGEVDVGGWVEVQLQARQWLIDVLGHVEAGSLLLFDYGDTKEGLASRRPQGTLRTYRNHHLGPDPLDEPGETDITADVNFSALVETARSIPRTDVCLTRQEDFLGDLGLRDRLEDLRRSELDMAADPNQLPRLRARSLKTEAETLLHPRGLGDFRAMCVTIREPGEGLETS